MELFVDGAKRGLAMPWHLECSVFLLDIYRGAGADPAVRRGSTLAVAWLLQITGGFELLRSHLKAALNDYPDDAEVLFARAVLEEAGASSRLAGLPNERKSAKALREAEATYRSVLRADPGLMEARVRLGYVLLRLQRLEDARHELTAALAVARRNVTPTWPPCFWQQLTRRKAAPIRRWSAINVPTRSTPTARSRPSACHTPCGCGVRMKALL